MNFRTVLLSGGAGSLGTELVRVLLAETESTIRILDNSEYAMHTLRERFIDQEKRLRFTFGDVRDLERLRMAVEGCDAVYHLAAMKHIWIGERNPQEVYATNVQGTQNVIQACLDEYDVRVCMFCSTDKAVYPSSFYGKSKAMGEELVLKANNIKGDRITAFSVYRPMNFFMSRGNVVEKWMNQTVDGQPLTLVPGMKRHFIGVGKAAELLHIASTRSLGGEIWVPKGKEYGVDELAELFGGEIKEVPPTLGEKLTEALWTDVEARFLRDEGEMWCIRRPTL